MLQQIAEGVYVHESEFLQSNSVVVQGANGVLLIDPGITRDELSSLADDLREIGQSVVAGFSTHPDWDHVLWSAQFGDTPRYGSARCAFTIADFLSKADWKEQLIPALPPEHADEIPTELLGLITGLPVGTTHVPWDGPALRIIEHQAHAPGHAALLIEDRGVLVAGDMLSDILMPFLDLDAAKPIDDYLAALRLFENLADEVEIIVVPGHGSVSDPGQFRARIEQDRAYVHDLQAGSATTDPRVDPSGPLYWLADVHDWQAKRLSGDTVEESPE